MKIKFNSVEVQIGRVLMWGIMAGLFCAGQGAKAASFVKADNTTDLNQAASWTVGSGVPGSGDLTIWDNTFSAGNNSANVGTNLTWAGIVVSNNLQSAYTINATGTNVLTIGALGINMTNASQSFAINAPVAQGGNEVWGVNAGQALTFGGVITGGTPNANNLFNLTTIGAGTINFNGNYSDTLTSTAQGQLILVNTNTVNINPGANGSFVSYKKIAIGNVAGATTTLNILSGTNYFGATNYFVMCDNASASSVLNITGGQTTFANSSQSFANALKGTGVVNVAHATVIFGPNTRVAIGSDQVNGFTGADGTLNINNGGLVIVTNSASQYFSLGNGGPSSFGKGRLYLYGGGTLVCARNIIKNQANATGFVTFNGGTLKAGFASTAYMQGLTTATVSTNGGTIDDGGFAVTIAQPLLHDATLTTDGGLIKQGAGTVTLSGASTYNGGTAVNAGTLVIPSVAASAPGNYTVAGGAGLIIRAGTAGASVGMNALTLNAGSALTLDESSPSLAPSAPVIVVTNALTPSSTVVLNLTNTVISAGQYPLIKYGTLGGAGINAFALGSTPLAVGVILSLTNNTANQSIDLLITTATSVTWNGNLSSVWDIGGTANWQGGQFYAQTAGVGPNVNFDDTASGTTAVTLNTTVSPAGIVANNSGLSYSISGSGQIAGSGALLKNGSGTLTLATANTFTNLTSIVNGTLQLGDGTASNGSVGGNIIDGAALVVANPNPQTINNLISGSGSLTKSGAGTLTLTSSNTLSGAVAISAGVLTLNQGGTGGSVPVLGSASSVSVASGAVLALASANSLGTSNAVLPSVNLADTASLTTTAVGTNYVGSLTLGAATASGSGALFVNGNITNTSAATVNVSSFLSGSAVILLGDSSTLTINSNWNFGYGNGGVNELITSDVNGGSPGTLTTKGNVNALSASVELEWLTWNFDLGSNSMLMNSKLTVGKGAGLPVFVNWLSGTGLIAKNDYFAVADGAGGTEGHVAVSGGSLTISNNANRCLIGNGGTGSLDVSGGSLSFLGNNPIQLGGDINFAANGANGTLNISGNGLVVVGPLSGGLRLAADKGTFTGITGTINLNGGTLKTWASISNSSTLGGNSSYINFNGGTLKAGTNNATFLRGLTQASVLAGGANIDDGGFNVTIGQSLVDGGTGGGLNKLGVGTLILTNSSTYTGTTVISNGTLEVDGSIAGGQVSVISGAALSGVGNVAGPVLVNAGGTLVPGANTTTTNVLGTLTINNNLTLNGSLLIALNEGLAQSNSMVAVSGVLTNGGMGTVTVTNLGPTLAVGDSFKVFSQPVLNGNALTILPAGGVTWSNNLAVDGSIRVLTVAPLINPLPGVIQASLSGGTLNLLWPTNLGWVLQAQINTSSVGLSTNWVNLPGSATVTNFSTAVDPSKGSVFYRLVHP